MSFSGRIDLIETVNNRIVVKTIDGNNDSVKGQFMFLSIVPGAEFPCIESYDRLNSTALTVTLVAMFVIGSSLLFLYFVMKERSACLVAKTGFWSRKHAENGETQLESYEGS